jgi:virginiamycin B lyase
MLRSWWLGLLAALVLVQPAYGQTFDMKLVSGTDPWFIAPAPDNTVWFVDNVGPGPAYRLSPDRLEYLSYLGWQGNQRVEFGFDPSLAVEPSGVTWAAGRYVERPLARIDAQNNVTYTPPLPSGALPNHVAWGPDNALWFTLVTGTYSSTTVDRIGRRGANGTVTEFGGITPGAKPATIIPGPDGNLWFLEPGINSIGRITPQGATTEFPLPPGMKLVTVRGRELTFGPGGDLFFLVEGGIARMTQAGTVIGVITGGLTDFTPNAVAYARDGNLWATECGANTVTRISPAGVVTRAPAGSFPTRACPNGIVASADGTPWFFEWNTGRAGRVMFASPLATTDDASEVSSTTAMLNGLVAPRGAATTVYFEYGPTAAYGYRTAGQAIGDGDATVPASARLADLAPRSTYHYRLVATSVIGTVRGADTTVTTSAPPPVPAPPPPPDRDGDGYPVTVDCDDLSAAIHPGAYDRPQDRIDQDCSGADARFERFQPNADAGWKKVKGRYVFTRLVIDEMPAGSSLTLACTGPGCTARGYTATLSRPARRLDVSGRLKKAKLRKGAVVELQLSRPGYVTTVVRWTIGPPPRMTILCQAPGAKKPTAC